jgi:hypothetical protein
MAIPLTWRNVFAMVGLVASVLTGFVMGTSAMIDWRISAINRQLVDRMTLYQREMERVERRIERLEERQ